MPEEKIAGIMREFVKAMAAGEVDKTLSYFTDDAVDIGPDGTYKGKTEIKRSLEAMARNFKDMKVTETGNGIITQGDKAFFEHVLSGTYQGQKFEFLAMCAYEFSGEKIKNVRSVLVQSFSDKSMVPKCYNSPQFLSSLCLRCRFGSSFTPPRNWGSAHESDFFLASVHLLSPGGCFPQFGLSLSQ